jgi:hypothetical protein
MSALKATKPKRELPTKIDTEFNPEDVDIVELSPEDVDVIDVPEDSVDIVEDKPTFTQPRSPGDAISGIADRLARVSPTEFGDPDGNVPYITAPTMVGGALKGGARGLKNLVASFLPRSPIQDDGSLDLAGMVQNVPFVGPPAASTIDAVQRFRSASTLPRGPRRAVRGASAVVPFGPQLEEVAQPGLRTAEGGPVTLADNEAAAEGAGDIGTQIAAMALAPKAVPAAARTVNKIRGRLASEVGPDFVNRLLAKGDPKGIATELEEGRNPAKALMEEPIDLPRLREELPGGANAAADAARKRSIEVSIELEDLQALPIGKRPKGWSKQITTLAKRQAELEAAATALDKLAAKNRLGSGGGGVADILPKSVRLAMKAADLPLALMQHVIDSPKFRVGAARKLAKLKPSGTGTKYNDPSGDGDDEDLRTRDEFEFTTENDSGEPTHENSDLVDRVPMHKLLPERFRAARHTLGASAADRNFKPSRARWGLSYEEEDKSKGLQRFDNMDQQPKVTYENEPRVSIRDPSGVVKGEYGPPRDVSSTITSYGDNSNEPFTTVHEYGHAIMQADMTDQERAAWEKLYWGYRNRYDELEQKQYLSRRAKFEEHINNAPTQTVRVRLIEAEEAQRRQDDAELAKISIPRALKTRTPHEALPSIIAHYILDSSALKKTYPDIYGFVKQIFGGREYINQVKGGGPQPPPATKMKTKMAPKPRPRMRE